ncbi:protein TolQ [Suttonella sp. R2A3]|uniref:protein TolQ n=1 Tax=Suttonella sp. R2A3 TaxID=2908648 RepID=UPI001F2105C8|nr:protein TolQ [Suttonella sp. R2A3]
MALLFVMFLLTLFMTGKKWVQFERLKSKSKQFDEQFWRSRDLQQLYEHYLERDPESVERIFIEGFREFKQFKQTHLESPDAIVENCRRAMEAAMNRECRTQENHLNMLATFGSSAPYIGLLGTVYGIMNSFIALGGTQQASIASVAPGIAEALIATAIGLLAAIPSVLAYNFFIGHSDRLSVEYEAFIEEFSNILQRQILAAKSKMKAKP